MPGLGRVTSVPRSAVLLWVLDGIVTNLGSPPWKFMERQWFVKPCEASKLISIKLHSFLEALSCILNISDIFCAHQRGWVEWVSVHSHMRRGHWLQSLRRPLAGFQRQSEKRKSGPAKRLCLQTDKHGTVCVFWNSFDVDSFRLYANLPWDFASDCGLQLLDVKCRCPIPQAVVFFCCRGIMADHCWRMITHRNRQSLRQRKDCCSMFGIVYRAGREKETQSFWALHIWMLGLPWRLDNDDNGSSDSNATGDVGECNCIHFDETSPWMDIPFMEMAWNLVMAEGSLKSVGSKQVFLSSSEWDRQITGIMSQGFRVTVLAWVATDLIHWKTIFWICSLLTCTTYMRFRWFLVFIFGYMR